MGSPETTKPAEPFVGVTQRIAVDGIQPSRTVWPNGGEAGLAQDPELRGHRRLCDAELSLDRR
jgi:hypothetical protein